MSVWVSASAPVSASVSASACASAFASVGRGLNGCATQQCSFSGDAKWLLTGSYHNYLHIYDRIGKGDVCIEATKTPKKRLVSKGRLNLPRPKAKKPEETGEMDMDKKVCVGLSVVGEKWWVSDCGEDSQFLLVSDSMSICAPMSGLFHRE